MTERINDNIVELLMRSRGIDVSRYDWSFLDNSVQERMGETHCSLVEEYCDLLGQKDKEELSLLELLHNSHSEFFRNPLTFAVLERVILPALVLQIKSTGRKEIRIWLTACAAGQEAYSLAILLEELNNGNTHNFAYRLFATDKTNPG